MTPTGWDATGGRSTHGGGSPRAGKRRFQTGIADAIGPIIWPRDDENRRDRDHKKASGRGWAGAQRAPRHLTGPGNFAYWMRSCRIRAKFVPHAGAIAGQRGSGAGLEDRGFGGVLGAVRG